MFIQSTKHYIRHASLEHLSKLLHRGAFSNHCAPPDIAGLFGSSVCRTGISRSVVAFVSLDDNNERYLLLTKDNSSGRPRRVSICQSRADMI